MALREFGLLVLLFVCVSGQTSKITISPATNFVLTQGLNQVFEFRLTQPIICPTISNGLECAVIVLIQNPSSSIFVDKCVLKWLASEWAQPRTINVRTNPTFVDAGQITITLATDVAPATTAPFYQNAPIADIVLTSAPKPSRTCSATGDPHYTTFDGYYWHQYEAGQLVHVRSTSRRFEIQTKMLNYPARHCAAAGLEGADMVILDMCNKRMSIETRFTSPSGSTPRIITSGNTITVNFISGAWMRVNYYDWWFDIYVSVPGQYYKATVGLCGNNNGIQTDDSPAYMVTQNKLLFNDQKVFGRTDAGYVDLFNFWPVGGVVPIVSAVSTCIYVPPNGTIPILNPVIGEDITDSIKTDTPPVAGASTIAPILLTEPVTSTLAPVSLSDAIAYCQQGFSTSTVVQSCTTLGMNVTTYLKGCTEDVLAGGRSPEWISSALQQLQVDCAVYAATNNQTGTVINSMCPSQTTGQCSGNGQCSQGVCTCNTGFTGNDCALNLLAPPTVLGLDQTTCDSQGLLTCPTNGILVSGRNVILSPSLTCKFGIQLTQAVFLGSNQVLCAFPTKTVRGVNEQRVPLSISNNGVDFSNSVDVIYYDSKCLVCTGNTCAANPTSCVIGGVCYLTSQVSDSNPCQVCNPAKSSNSWSYGYTSSACYPTFSLSLYKGVVVGSATAGQAIVTATAANPLVAGDSSNTLTYRISATDVNNAFMNFTINPTTGVISPKNAFTVANIDKKTFLTGFGIEAVDAFGNIGHASVFINLLTTNVAPNFNSTSYSATIPESAGIGYHVLQVFASDSGTSTTMTYSFQQEEPGYAGVFAINALTGEITVVKALNFEAKASYSVVVKVTDQNFLSQFATVNINISNVNEAPVDILLSSTSVAENSVVGTTVGILSAVDPDAGDSFTYTLKSTGVPFSVSGGQVKTTAVLDFEGAIKYWTISVEAKDAAGLAVLKSFNITVSNVNEAPSSVSLGGTTVVENSGVGVGVGVVTAVDPEGDAYSCTLTNDGNGKFQIVNNVLQVSGVNNIDYETTPSIPITIVCADSNVDAKYSNPFSFTITVLDQAEGPVLGGTTGLLNQFANNGVPENTVTNSPVAVVQATDPDMNSSNFTFTVAVDSQGQFTVGPTTCVVNPNTTVTCTATISNIGAFDFENNSQPVVHIIATPTNGGPAQDLYVPINVANVNEPANPIWESGTTGSVQEFSDVNTLIGRLLANDPDEGDTHTWQLISPADGSWLIQAASKRRDVSGEIAEVRLGSASSIIDFEDPTKNSFTVSIAVTDNHGLSFTKSFTIGVTDRPMDIYHGSQLSAVPLTINENTTPGNVAPISIAYFDRDTDVNAAISMDANQYFRYDTEGLLVLKSNLDYEQVKSTTLTFHVTFTRKALAPSTLPMPADFTKTIQVVVNDVNEPPVFTGATTFNVNTDTLAGSVVATGSVADPDGEAITSLAVSNAHFTVVLSGNTYSIKLSQPFTQFTRGVHSASYPVVLSASSASGQVVNSSSTFNVVDDCAGTGCSDEFCIDQKNSYVCCPDEDYIELCTPPEDLSASSAAASAASGGALAGIVIGALAALVLIALIALVIIRKRNALKQAEWADENGLSNPCYGYVGNPNGTMPKQQQQGGMDSSLNNPIYSWYLPDVSRQEIDEMLTDQAEGAFVVRDISATPGWHMLAVRTPNSIIHEKIKCEEGLYELLPGPGGVRQPRFRDLPELVEHYSQNQDGVRFKLSLDNSLYDNSRLAGRAVAAKWAYENDPSAPAVPLKERELAVAEQLAEGDDIYTNTTEAKSALATSV